MYFMDTRIFVCPTIAVGDTVNVPLTVVVCGVCESYISYTKSSPNVPFWLKSIHTLKYSVKAPTLNPGVSCMG